MTSLLVSQEADAAVPGSQPCILRWLMALGLVTTEVRPASKEELAGRIEDLANKRLRELVLPPDIMALYKLRTKASSGMITVYWTLVVGLVNIPTVGFDIGTLPRHLWPAVMSIQIFVTLMYMLSAYVLKRRQVPGLEHLFITLPCVITVALAGVIGLLTGSADLFRSNLTMSVLIAITAIVFAQIDLKGAIWLGALTILTMASFVIPSPLPSVAEKAQMLAFYASVMAGIIYGKHIQDFYRFRVFVMQIREEIRTEAAARRNEQLSSIAYTDRLTDIPNRRYFDEITETISADPKAVLPLSMCMLDIDHFKNLNDKLGHLQGDRCLRVVSTTIRNTLRHNRDIVARFGGEEFVLLLPNTDAGTAREVAERVREAVFSLNHPNPGTPAERVSISAGLAVASTPGAVPGLLQEADKALYRAKAGGRNRVGV